MRPGRAILAVLGIVATIALWPAVERVFGHCDTMDGPIVPEARQALNSGDVTPVLKWVREEDEATIRDAFERAQAVRSRDDEDVREIADRYFLETLIRVHRESEGEVFTGLKPAGSAPKIFRRADAALDSGSVGEIATEISGAVGRAIEERFETVIELRKNAGESVAAGRRYVAAYVAYMHFVEGIHGFLEHGAAGHHFESAAGR